MFKDKKQKSNADHNPAERDPTVPHGDETPEGEAVRPLETKDAPATEGEALASASSAMPFTGTKVFPASSDPARVTIAFWKKKNAAPAQRAQNVARRLKEFGWSTEFKEDGEDCSLVGTPPQR